MAASWRLGGRRPLHLKTYGRELLRECERSKASCVIATGIAPITREVLIELQKRAVRVMNYLTDDPWNPANCAPWFFKALPYYEHIFTPRRSNTKDLERAGARAVSFLPFAYSPDIHVPDSSPIRDSESAVDVIFVGGGDRDRVPYFSGLASAGFRLALYGGFWDRYRETRRWARGFLPARETKVAMARAKIAVCLVRRANRDGHCMRTFEIPAMRGCMLAEDTNEHREIFGAEGLAVQYFRTISELVEKSRWLRDHPAERQRLAQAGHQLITTAGHTYQDRLTAMVSDQ
jgi:spore maturation protein CgeB